jgi:hypothetical protein
VYCGQSVLRDVEDEMELFKPTDIYVTHPNDDHPDHAAAGAFVKTALDALREKGDPWAQTAKLHYYLVHHGDWPVPQGLHESYPLPPPAGMTATDTVWTDFPLTVHEVQRKYAAIKRYRSQTAITGRFLFAFARSNELFGRIGNNVAHDLPAVPDGAIRMDADAADWGAVPPMVIDPVGDSVLREVQGGGDIARIYAARDSRSLYVRLDMNRPVSTEIRYALTVRAITLGSRQPQSLSFAGLPPPEGVIVPIAGPRGAEMIWKGRTIEYRIPNAAVGLGPTPGWEEIYVLADTRIARMPIDRSGLRGVLVDGRPAVMASAGRPPALPVH